MVWPCGGDLALKGRAGWCSPVDKDVLVVESGVLMADVMQAERSPDVLGL